MGRNTRVVNAVTAEVPIQEAGYDHDDVTVGASVTTLGDFHSRCSRVLISVEDAAVRYTYDDRDPVNGPAGSEVGHYMPAFGEFDLNVVTARSMKLVEAAAGSNARLIITEFE
jgi:hypothetical protein